MPDLAGGVANEVQQVIGGGLEAVAYGIGRVKR
jgi:hypothetical protein